MNARHLTWEPDPAFDAGGLMRVLGRAGPFFLAGVLGGEIRITNGPLPPTAISLYRFATLGQAALAGAVIRRHARLSEDGLAWEVAAVADHRPLADVDGQMDRLVRWARNIEPDIEDALALAGPGHYSLLRALDPTPRTTRPR